MHFSTTSNMALRHSLTMFQLAKSSGLARSALPSVTKAMPACNAQAQRLYSQQTGSTAMPPKPEREADFGFRKVKEEEKAQLVGQVFHSVAQSYDLMNDLMSGGVHRLWKDYFVQKLGPLPGTKILDVAGGTGDIAFREVDFMRTASPTHGGSVVVCDINTSMLEVGKQRARERGYRDEEISWVAGDAEKLPFDDNTFDAYTIAFGIRNVTHIDQALSEAYRVLKPGGRFMCLEFSRVNNPVIKTLYDAFSFEIIPVIGELVANDRASYQYLVESIRKFPDQERFLAMMVQAGFKAATFEDLTFGVTAVHSGFKLK
eukprot:comp21571_c0_seq1/m.30140 comp21571_c0_seq1/g.30140  ORF comp21571_c0_seq1/g.30140 comp21571_c0_seq1/m.30140 type:complete len:316 (-) comp21571_c0_seq1:249-1196(-)